MIEVRASTGWSARGGALEAAVHRIADGDRGPDRGVPSVRRSCSGTDHRGPPHDVVGSQEQRGCWSPDGADDASSQDRHRLFPESMIDFGFGLFRSGLGGFASTCRSASSRGTPAPVLLLWRHNSSTKHPDSRRHLSDNPKAALMGSHYV